MFTGSLIMRPVAYDAFSAGISGRTFAIPMASTPPRAPPRKARPGSQGDVRARLVGDGGGQRLAAKPLQIAQVAELHLPVPIGREVGREPRGVVESAEQLLDEEGQLLGCLDPSSRVHHREGLHYVATAAAGSGSRSGARSGCAS